MKFLLSYLKSYKWFITVALIIKTAGTLVELAIPYILSHILDNVVPTGQVRLVVLYGACMLGCAMLALLGNVIANRMAARVARNTSYRVRHDLFERILLLSPAQIDAFTVPSLESRLTSDTYNVHHFVGMSMRMGVRAPMLLMGGLIVTLLLDRNLTLVMVAVLPFIFITVYGITRRGIPLFRKSQGSVDAMVRVVREDAQGIRVIKALSKLDYETEKYDKANRRLVEDEQRASITMAGSNPLVTFFLNFGLCMVILVGAFLVNRDLTQPGRIIAFIQYFTMMSMAMLGITRIFVQYSKCAASAGRIAEVIRTEEDLRVAEQGAYPRRSGEPFLVFDDVSFSYLGKKDNLSHISLTLEKGESLGVIGATGSGKTTLCALLMRFYDVREGGIRLDGQDIRCMSHEELNTRFGVVMPNDFIYADTVMENIRFGRDISDEAVYRAARMAQASEFIEQLEDGYNHMLTSKGTNVSGGQKQRILIARALAGSPELLILDDASSALDYKTDARLRRAIREDLEETTLIVVAQRVSSVMSCRKILVLEEGRAVACGTHEELLATCDIYREISESQMGGAILE